MQDDEATVTDIKLGSQVTVIAANGACGTVKYIGETKFAEGIWCGIEVDDKRFGRNNGSVNGVEYFEVSTDGCGLFTKIENVKLLDPSSLSSKNSDDVIRLKRIVKLLQQKCIQLKFECEQIKQKTQYSKSTDESVGLLQETVEHLTLREEDLTSQNMELEGLKTQLEGEKNKLLQEVSLLKENLSCREATDAEINQKIIAGTNVDKIDLLRENTRLQKAIDDLERSLTDTIHDYEVLMSEYSDLIETNAVLEDSIQVLNTDLENSAIDIRNLQREVDAIKDDKKIVERVTTENNELSLKLAKLESKLKDLKKNKSEHERLLQESNDREEELKKSLKDSEIITENYNFELQKLRSDIERLSENTSANSIDEALIRNDIEIATIEEELYKNELLKELYMIALPEKEGGEFFYTQKQFSYFYRKMDDKRIRNSLVEKIQIKFILLMLSEICKCMSFQSHSIDARYTPFNTEVFSIKSWTNYFLEGYIPLENIHIEEIFQFMCDVPILNNNVELSFHILGSICLYMSSILFILYSEGVASEERSNQLQVIENYVKDLSEISKDYLSVLEDDQTGKLKYYTFTNSSTTTFLKTFYDKVLTQLQPKDNSNLTKVINSLHDITDHISRDDIFDIHEVLSKVEDLDSEHDHISVNSQEMELELLQKQKLLANKEDYIKELLLKIEILQEKAGKNKELEDLIDSLRIQVRELEKEKTGLNDFIIALKDKLESVKKNLESQKINASRLIVDDGLNETILSYSQVDRNNLISEIKDLRSVIKHKTLVDSTNLKTFDWLYANSSKKLESNESQSTFNARLRELNKNVDKIIDSTELLLFEPENDFEKVGRYVAKLKHKQSLVINKLKDLSK